MPRVEHNAEVSLVVLTYRSLRWLEWAMDRTDFCTNKIRYRWFVVANDPTDEVGEDPRIAMTYRNSDPAEFYINRVYRAWNAGVLEAPTETVIMLNSDMAGSSYWIDELVDEKRMHPAHVPTSLLVESGRLPSGMPEHVHDFGMDPDSFDATGFSKHASRLRKINSREPGRLYMPILVERQEFLDLGGYPEGNPPGTTGDKDLIRRYSEAGMDHVTCLGSVVYHCVQGEQHWPEPSQP